MIHILILSSLYGSHIQLAACPVALPSLKKKGGGGGGEIILHLALVGSCGTLGNVQENLCFMEIQIFSLSEFFTNIFHKSDIF